MLDRRRFVSLVSTTILGTGVPRLAHAAPVSRIVFVHGRQQEGLDPAVLKAEWRGALKRGIQGLGKNLSDRVEVAFPYYGDLLYKFARQFEIPLTSEVTARGGAVDDEFLAFQAGVAEAVREKIGVTLEQVDKEYGNNPRAKGPLNWEWVQAILRAIDKHVRGVSATALEILTRDVFLYATRAGVRDEIDAIVKAVLTEAPTIVVGHSLGSIVAYSVLRTDSRALRVPLLVTIGSPLGIRPIRDQFRPLKHPAQVKTWFNAYDRRDGIALHALDSSNFPVTPPIENFDGVRNHTRDRHGALGYLEAKAVASKVWTALSG
jgi:hypothetical protein